MWGVTRWRQVATKTFNARHICLWGGEKYACPEPICKIIWGGGRLLRQASLNTHYAFGHAQHLSSITISSGIGSVLMFQRSSCHHQHMHTISLLSHGKRVRTSTIGIVQWRPAREIPSMPRPINPSMW